jgi:hypothetical protein
LPWQSVLFKQGAGCPCCEGEKNGWSPQTLSDIENGEDDPTLRLVAAEKVAEGTAPKWERPKDPVHWTCDGCGVEAITDVDTNELGYRVPYTSKARGWYCSHPFSAGAASPEKIPAHTFDSGEKVCEYCLSHCSGCSAPLSEYLELDTYDEGCAMPSTADDREYVCIDCLDKVESEEANRVWKDCYSAAERVAYIRERPDQFDGNFQSFADLLACVRGKYFAGYASELLY